MQVAVVYLFWVPYGRHYIDAFLDSYRQYESGFPHKLLIVFNGMKYADKSETDSIIKDMYQSGMTDLEFVFYDEGFDIDTYKKIATDQPYDNFLFLNTYSVIKAKNWLQFYKGNWHDSTGLIGATSSYASYYSSIKELTKFEIRYGKSAKMKLDRIKYLIKLFFRQRSHFHDFPAPHIRTNAFFTSKSIFNLVNAGPFNNKMDTYYFENGKNSLTNQILSLGLECIVIDKSGKSYKQAEWKLSNTFWRGSQENLLIADNQTTKYEEADNQYKELYCRIAWGE